MDIACLLLQYLRITKICAPKKNASILVEGSGKEYTEIAIECQDYFRNFIEETTAVLAYEAIRALTIYYITLPI